MAPEKSPAFQFYPKDYLTDPRVRAMTFEQRGLYWEAIGICWLEGSLPSDLGELAAILGCPKRRLEVVWPRIGLCFEAHGDRLTHKRLDKERSAQAESRDRRRDAAQKRWDKEQKPDAMHMQSTTCKQSPVDAKQCSPSSSPSPSASSTSTAVNTVPSAPMPPLISGQANPRDWGRIHGNHETGFCDWVCLPDFLFEEFRLKSGHTKDVDTGRPYVSAWAAGIRAKFHGQTIGEDGLKFWRARWAESHAPKSKPINIQELLDRETAKKSIRAVTAHVDTQQAAVDEQMAIAKRYEELMGQGLTRSDARQVIQQERGETE